MKKFLLETKRHKEESEEAWKIRAAHCHAHRLLKSKGRFITVGFLEKVKYVEKKIK